MLSIECVKELINDPKFSDKEIEEIRDGFYQQFKVEVFYKEVPDKKDRVRQLWDTLVSLPESEKKTKENGEPGTGK